MGPNGAGKSTMMKILTCFLPQTSGTALVNGYDVAEFPIEVKKSVGYLAEHNPLYTDMFIQEYLTFVAGLHPDKIEKGEIQKRVKKMIEITGLHVEQKKKIGALSKGYRQRVGLAQALIHDPQVLILDEPTTGLDPNQLAEIRNLIREIGKEKTVMLSTHIMQEVEAICGRVIIINRGQIVADDTTANVQHGSSKKQVITVEFQAPTSAQLLLKIPGIQHAKEIKNNVWKLSSDAQEDIRPVVFNFAIEHQLTVLTLNKEEERLEDVFKDLTGSL